jgi:hypothetical protein
MSFLKKFGGLLVAVALLSMVQGGVAPTAAEVGGTGGDPDAFAVTVEVSHAQQSVLTSLTHGPPGGIGFLRYEITAEWYGNQITAQVGSIVTFNAGGRASFSAPLDAHCLNIGNFMVSVSAYYVDAVSQTMVTAETRPMMTGLHLSDVTEIAGIDPAAYQQIINTPGGPVIFSATAPPTGGGVPPLPPGASNAFTPTVPGQPGGVWFKAGPEGVFAGN